MFIEARPTAKSSPSPLNGERAGLSAIGSATAEVRGEKVRLMSISTAPDDQQGCP